MCGWKILHKILYSAITIVNVMSDLNAIKILHYQESEI